MPAQDGLPVHGRAEGERCATEFLIARQIKTDASFLSLKAETFLRFKERGPFEFP
jgi:hypothetical protein